MANFQHPEESLLLRYIDGELPGRKARQIRHHLEACWQCRGAVEELESTVAECVRYRKEIPAYLPAAPQPWADLSREFARIDASLASEPFWKRYLTFPVMRQAFAGAAVLVLLAAVIYQFQRVPTVKAAVLLKRAVAAESARTAAVHKVRIRTRKDSFVRTVGTKVVADASMPGAMETLFAEAHYNAEDPLSVRSFQQWHDSLPQLEDDAVETVPDPVEAGECYRIHASSASSEVSGATLLLAQTDLHAVAGRIEFRNQDFVEFTEILESPVGNTLGASAHVEAPVPPVVPSRGAAVVPEESASVSDQLAALAVIHQIGADLGEPVEVKLSGGKVVVGGVGVAPQFQQRIHEELDTRRNVSVQFSEPRALAGNRVMGSSSNGGSSGTAVQNRLEDQLGSRVEFQRFRDTVLKSNQVAMDRAYALRRLAQDFPVDVESGLRPNDRRMLRDMLQDHLSQLSKQAVDVQSLLLPSLSAIGATVQARRPAEGSVWQLSVEEVLRASQLVEVRLSVLLGVTPGQNNTSTQLPSEVLTALADLRAQVDHCTSLIKQ